MWSSGISCRSEPVTNSSNGPRCLHPSIHLSGPLTLRTGVNQPIRGSLTDPQCCLPSLQRGVLDQDAVALLARSASYCVRQRTYPALVACHVSGGLTLTVRRLSCL